MHSTSREPSSNQRHLHPKLARTVQRHLKAQSLKPVAPHNVAAFNTLLAELATRPRPLILDSFCGTGHSTATLARHYPGHLVVGIDKSRHRLGRHPHNQSANSLLLQAECEDFWRLLVAAGMGVEQHYLLYPNPWPKAKHLQRRIHGGAGFAWLVQLAAGNPAGSKLPHSPGSVRIELRSNWQTYVEEFGVAMHLAGYPGIVARVSPESAISLFERKYRDSGHNLWAFTATAGQSLSPGGDDLAPGGTAGLTPAGSGRDETAHLG